MDAALTDLREALANFLDREVAEAAIQGEADGKLAPEWSKRLGDLGYLDLGSDQPAGGLGLIAEAIVVAEVARVWGALAVSVASTLLAVRALAATKPGHGVLGHGLNVAELRNGTAAVATARLPGLASGTRLVVGTPKPDALLLLPHSRQQDGAATLLAGSAAQVVNQTEYEGLRGLSGTTVTESSGQVLSSDVSADLLAADRILLSAVAAGLAQGALDIGIAYANERVQFGQPIGAYGEIQALLVRASARAVAARHAALFAAQLFDGGDRSIASATRIFLNNSEAAVRVGERVQHVHGGYGHMREYEAGRYVRDARTLASLVGSHAELDRFLARDLGLAQPRRDRKQAAGAAG